MQKYALELYPSLGMNTALNPANLPQGAQRKALDAVMREVNTIGKRDGSAPVTTTAIGTIGHLTAYKTSASSIAADLLASIGTTLYKFNGTDTLTAQTMTNAINSADINTVGFTNTSNVSILFITDGAAVKQYNGSAVANITPAANDPAPAPANDLANINLKGPKYAWVHTGHIFISAGTDLVWYSKRFNFDYFPSTQFFRFVRNNDYMTGPGLTFNDVCLIPMRRGWGVLIGEVFDDGTVPNGFKGNLYLNTVNGNISPRGFAKITYPGGSQTVAYLSDDGVHEIYDTGFTDDGSRQYSTKALMKDKIDFLAYGFTDAEKTAAVAFFDGDHSLIISIQRGTTYYSFVYDTRNQEWYVWRFPWRLSAFANFGGINYFGSTLGHLHSLSEDLYSDWTDKARTVGTPVDFDVYSGLLSFEFTGERSYLHYYVMEAQQFLSPGSIDVYVIAGNGTVAFPGGINTEIFIWGVSSWGEGTWANLDYTDIVNNANHLIVHAPAKYFQRRWRCNRDEPALILKERFIGNVSGVSGRS